MVKIQDRNVDRFFTQIWNVSYSNQPNQLNDRDKNVIFSSIYMKRSKNFTIHYTGSQSTNGKMNEYFFSIGKWRIFHTIILGDLFEEKSPDSWHWWFFRFDHFWTTRKILSEELIFPFTKPLIFMLINFS